MHTVLSVETFKTRGRGRPPNWFALNPGRNYSSSPICVAERKMLVIVDKIGRGGGKSTNVVLCGETHETPALKCQKLLRDGVFDAPLNSDTTTSANDLNNLPNRALIRVFSFINDAKTITACESVCRRWKTLITTSAELNAANCVYEKQNVKTLKFKIAKISSLECVYERNKTPDNGGRDSYDFHCVTWRIPIHYARQSYVVETVRRIFEKFRVVSALSFVGLEIDVRLLTLVVNTQSAVKQLRFFRCLLDGNALACLAHVGHIKELAVDHCYGKGDAISTRSILPVVQRNVFNRLELCGASTLTQVDDAVLEALLSNWKHHKFDFLKLKNCPNITTEAICKVANHYVRGDRKKLIVFLQNTGFDVEAFLKMDKGFVRSTATPTTKRLLLKNDTVLIWVETE